jgi:hypothetical protein
MNRLFTKRWFTKWVLKKLINSKGKTHPILTSKINPLNPTDLSDIDNIKAIYLGGGIDFALDNGNGWRTQVEEFFGSEHIVSDSDVQLIGQGKSIDTSKYKKPMIVNPLRNEPDRDDPDNYFSQMFQQWKKGELNDIDSSDVSNEMWVRWINIINESIKITDLHILNFCDTNLVKYDLVAGDGTKGELQMSDWANQKVFIWLGRSSKDSDEFKTVRNISPWTLPIATKILRNDSEGWNFLQAIKDKFSK